MILKRFYSGPIKSKLMSLLKRPARTNSLNLNFFDATAVDSKWSNNDDYNQLKPVMYSSIVTDSGKCEVDDDDVVLESEMIFIGTSDSDSNPVSRDHSPSRLDDDIFFDDICPVRPCAAESEPVSVDEAETQPAEANFDQIIEEIEHELAKSSSDDEYNAHCTHEARLCMCTVKCECSCHRGQVTGSRNSTNSTVSSVRGGAHGSSVSLEWDVSLDLIDVNRQNLDLIDLSNTQASNRNHLDDEFPINGDLDILSTINNLSKSRQNNCTLLTFSLQLNIDLTGMNFSCFFFV